MFSWNGNSQCKSCIIDPANRNILGICDGTISPILNRQFNIRIVFRQIFLISGKQYTGTYISIGNANGQIAKKYIANKYFIRDLIEKFILIQKLCMQQTFFKAV